MNALVPVPDHGARAHSLISASGTYIWWACPDSVTTFGHLPSVSSVYAEEGTAAHELANFCLVERKDAIELIGRTFNGFTVDEEMSDAVQVYLDECRRYMVPGWTYFIEHRFTLEELGPPAPMFGTADFVAYNAELRLMVVIDLKYGKGIVVEAVDNPQPRYYALGAYYAIPGNPPVDQVLMAIVQPRVPRGNPIKTDQMSLLALLDWSLALMDRARLAMSGHGGMKAGSHCKFCKGSGRCAVEASARIAMAQDAFAGLEPSGALAGTVITDDDLSALVMGEPVPAVRREQLPAQAPVNLPDVITPPDIRTLTPEQMSRYLLQAEMVEDWITALRKAAHTMVEQGIDIPEFKLVDKRPTSKWKNPDSAVLVLTKKLGLPKADLYAEPQMLSPAQARELAIAAIRKARPGFKKKDIAEFVVKVLDPEIAAGSSGPTLVHASDPRPALTGRGDEFDCLPAYETTESSVP